MCRGGDDVGPVDFGTLKFGKGLQLATNPTAESVGDDCKEWVVNGWT